MTKPLSPNSVTSPFVLWNLNETGTTISAVSNRDIPDMTISGTGNTRQVSGAMSCEALAVNADNIAQEATPDAELGSILRMDDVPNGIMIIAFDLAFTSLSASIEEIFSYGRDRLLSGAVGETPGLWGIFMSATVLGIHIREHDATAALTTTTSATPTGILDAINDGERHTHVMVYSFANDSFQWFIDGTYYPLVIAQISDRHDVTKLPTLATGLGIGANFFHKKINNPTINSQLGASTDHEVSLYRMMVLKSPEDLSRYAVKFARDFHLTREGLPQALRLF